MFTADSGGGDIELSVAEDGLVQVNGHALQSLALRLVYGYGESRTHWELSPFPLEWEDVIRRP